MKHRINWNNGIVKTATLIIKVSLSMDKNINRGKTARAKILDLDTVFIYLIEWTSSYYLSPSSLS